MLEDLKLSGINLLVYALIFSKRDKDTNECSLSKSTIAKILNTSERTIFRAILSLEKRKLIDSIGKTKSNKLKILYND